MKNYLLPLLCLFLAFSLFSQEEKDSLWAPGIFKGLKFRSIGPAKMAGRIADIAIHPKDDNVWYVAVGSGGVWKTENAGVTWEPIFDDQSSYSIGCVTIDPNNHNVIWVGTGENVGGRHVGYGDGIYRSDDAGKNWKNLGLKNSEHISKIIVHPENSDIVWVAAQGPLWSKGGDRGLYKTTDGGKTWKKTLGDDEWVGVTDVVIDPRDPNRLYAATWQRHRNIAAYMGGGPGTGLHRSMDGGDTWEELEKGLPKSNMGKIGMAISPQKPDVLYAAIELDNRTGGVFRSTDRGSTWKKMSDAVAGATGPHYYQELYASPHAFDRIYLVDVRMQVSDDGGKTFRRMKEQYKHSDNHALAFRQDDPDYLLVGTDGGIYESFDLEENWRFIDNMPITQFYKLALDDATPFYNVYGGTQDNSTQGGPSRTDNVQGIQNSDWKIVLNWDGHQPATEPGNPDIMYGQRQQGTLSRIDLSTGEVVDIKPQPGPDEPHERFNWDAPILISPHSPTRLYFGSYRLWRSDNRGDSWTAVSGDLTRDQNRIELPIMGKKQSYDNPWDFSAMSTFNTLTSIAESPLTEGLIYIGTDDGLIQVTEDGGDNWRKIEVGSIGNVPKTAYVNHILADLHDENTVYVAFDNHKHGDFTPYIYKSTDRGNTWTSISSNIPGRDIVWRLAQDHVKPELLFAATEFGIYFTVNGGEDWIELQGGLPTISFRDIAIHRRENDLVGASFGRSFYILDDYTALRDVTEDQLNEEATLFPSRKAWWYVPRPDLSFGGGKGSQGASHFVAPNPPFGVVFTYYLKETYKTAKKVRKDKEAELAEGGKDIPFPGWAELEGERIEGEPYMLFEIKDDEGNVVRRITGPAKKGIQRVSWDLKHPAPRALDVEKAAEAKDAPSALMVAPGTYSVTMYKMYKGALTRLDDPQEFEVIPLYEGALEGAPHGDVADFWRQYEEAVRSSSAVAKALANGIKKVKAMQHALSLSNAEAGEMDEELDSMRQAILYLDVDLNGKKVKRQPGEKTKPTVQERLFAVSRAVSNSTYGPTETAKEQLDIALEDLSDIREKLAGIKAQMELIHDKLMEKGAPWLEGEDIPSR